ncbi:unnamed protein product, partial [Rotaria sp. Silwood1]
MSYEENILRQKDE